MKKDTQSRGFTIVELLIVVVVIAILATITIVSYNGIITRAKNAEVVSYLNTFSKKYQEQVILNNGNLTTAQFTSLQSSVVLLDDIGVNVSTLPAGGKIVNFCIDISDQAPLTNYFVNSSDRTSPTKGYCTNYGPGAYILE